MRYLRILPVLVLLVVAAGCGSGLKGTWEGTVDFDAACSRLSVRLPMAGLGLGTQQVRLECRSDGSVVIDGAKCNASGWRGNGFYVDEAKLDAEKSENPGNVAVLLADGVIAAACGPSGQVSVRWVDNNHFDIMTPVQPNQRGMTGHPALTWSFTRALARQ